MPDTPITMRTGLIGATSSRWRTRTSAPGRLSMPTTIRRMIHRLLCPIGVAHIAMRQHPNDPHPSTECVDPIFDKRYRRYRATRRCLDVIKRHSEMIRDFTQSLPCYRQPFHNRIKEGLPTILQELEKRPQTGSISASPCAVK